MNKAKIAIFTAGRSDFGIMLNLLKKIEKSKSLEQNIIIGPAHQLKIFGYTKKEILKYKFKKISYINSNFYKTKKQNTSFLISKIIYHSSEFLKKNKFDAAVILGDRYEVFSFSIACVNNRIPIIHLGGGSTTLGSLDEIYRNCISNMSSLHLVETKEHQKNLINIGIKKNIYIIGAPALEKINKNKQTIEKLNFNKSLDIKKKLIMACFHPETNKSNFFNINNLKILINFLNKVKQNVIFTYPNADEGYADYINIIIKNLTNKNSTIVKSLGIKNYHKLLSKSDLLIGNSSSGIIESGSFKVPFINLGDRQKGRFAPKNVINCSFNAREILKAYSYATSIRFKKKLIKFINPYEDSSSSDKALKHIKNYLKK